MIAPSSATAALLATLRLVFWMGGACALGVGAAHFTKLPAITPLWAAFVQGVALVAFAVGSLQLIEYTFESFKKRERGEVVSKWVTKGAYAVGCFVSGLYIGWSSSL